MKKFRILIALIVIIAMTAVMFGCAAEKKAPEGEGYAEEPAEEPDAEPAEEPEGDTEEQVDSDLPAEPGDADAVEPNGEIMILYTSDTHCGVDKGFGFAGLAEVRKSLEDQGYTTIIVDNGDAIQGEPIGMLSKGESIIEIMNAVKYDIAIPGNHEFDYGMEQFLHLTEMADFPYISCNLNKSGELLFKPYTIVEAAGIKIGFIGVTTPNTITESTPRNFQDESGNMVYGFMQESPEGLYAAVQKAVDDARAEGAEYIYVLGHMGMAATDIPWTYADVIEHTNGIDVFIDGHSHDSDQIVMKNKDGEEVVRTASGTKLASIGYSHIVPDEGIVETNIWTWVNGTSAVKLFGFDNQVRSKVDEKLNELGEELQIVVAKTAVDLTINDPVEVDDSGKPIRMVRRAETNLGDLCADAFRIDTGADIGLAGGGGVRVSVDQGDITYEEIISVLPFGNQICVIEVTGQQILDALEWGAHGLPGESGGFLQVSGLTYEIDANVPSGCQSDENGFMTEIVGERRVRNVMVAGEPINPEAKYTVAGPDYTLLKNGDGYTAFDGAEVVANQVKTDAQMLIDYIVDTLGGVIGFGYEDPYGEGRIVFVD